jgi:hypothetical protein
MRAGRFGRVENALLHASILWATPRLPRLWSPQRRS